MTDNESAGDDPDGEQLSDANSLTYSVDTNESPSDAIVRAVSAQTGRDILDIEPLYHVIDPNHVDGIFEKLGGDAGMTEISFEYSGCLVTVTHGEIHVEEMTETT